MRERVHEIGHLFPGVSLLTVSGYARPLRLRYRPDCTDCQAHQPGEEWVA